MHLEYIIFEYFIENKFQYQLFQRKSTTFSEGVRLAATATAAATDKPLNTIANTSAAATGF